MRDYITALPKVELHLHLVGSASVDTVLALARRHPDGGVPTEETRLRSFYEFTDFPHFIATYGKVNRLVRTGSDVTALVVGAAADLARHTVRYAELTVTPLAHRLAGVDPDELAEALTTGRRRAAEEHGVELAWIFDIPGGLEQPSSLETITWTLRHLPEGTVGLGLAGAEIDVPRQDFRQSFAMAADAGLRLAAHAGETTGPEAVWAAVHELDAERIGHGVSAVRDPRLLRFLAEHDIPVEVCPTSNIRTGAVRTMAEHPLPWLLDAGVPVTIATDDPGMFDTDLTSEYLVCHEQFGLGRGELTELARAGVRAAFCPRERKAELLAELDAYAA